MPHKLILKMQVIHRYFLYGFYAFSPILLIGYCHAKEPTYLDSNQLIEMLNLEPQTRGLGRLVFAERSVDLDIEFDYNSDNLSNSSVIQLYQLSIAMKSDNLKYYQFDVEGHTDAKGGKKYNKKLSEKRAFVVVEFLKLHGIDQRRLTAKGLGFEYLKNPDQPYAPENRRVRIVTKITE